MFPFKDVIPHPVRSHIVYKIQCERCDAFYIGKTYQCLANRCSRGLTGGEYHAFKDHVRENGDEHSYKIDDVKILATEQNKFKLLAKESLLIKHLNPPLNKMKLSVPILLF